MGFLLIKFCRLHLIVFADFVETLSTQEPVSSSGDLEYNNHWI